jgi:hypothetical protein
MDESLSYDSLFGGARKAAHRAMEDHGRGEYDEFALHAGVAVERLAKAVLMKLNPIYLVEMRNGNADLLLYFGGHLELDTSKVRTVGAGEALRRLRRMTILPADPQLDLLIELRNGTAHTTIGDQAKALLPTFSETVLTLLTALGGTSGEFWDRWARTMIVAVDKQLDEIRRDVEIRIDQARHLFEDRFKGLPDGVKQRVLEKPENTIGAITVRSSESLLALISTARCPACGTDAQVQLRPESGQPVETLRVHKLACRLCNLKLDNWEQVKAAGVDRETFDIPTSVALYWAEEEVGNVELDDHDG